MDPVSSELAEALKGGGFSVFQNVPYEHEGIRGEIDVLALKDSSAFVFECKNSLLPCSPFELRTSWDHVCKAASQLTIVKEKWGNNSFVAEIGDRLRISLLGSRNLGTCIVMGNRMFPGLQYKGHAVRPLFEICSFLSTGEWSLEVSIGSHGCTNPGRYIFKLWRGDSLTVADLFEFIGEDSPYKLVLASMEWTESHIECGSYKLIGGQFALNFESSFAKAKQRWRHSFIAAVQEPTS